MATITSDRKSFFKSFAGNQNTAEAKMGFFDHVEDLRWHLIRACAVFIITAAILFMRIDWIFDHIITAPARADFVSYGALCRFGHWMHIGDALCMPPVNINLQVNTVNGTFTSALSIAAIGGFIISLPYILWEIWRFVKPGLSIKEKKYARGGIFWISFYFFCGAAFGYFLMAPFTYNFLSTFTLGKYGMIKYIPSIDDYISSLSNVTLGCGLAFELPIIAYLLAKLGIITASFLKKQFKIALVIIMIVAGIITPSPDWISQLIVSIPLIILYWISILLVSKVDKQRVKV